MFGYISKLLILAVVILTNLNVLACTLGAGVSDALPGGSTGAITLNFSPDGSFLVTGNIGSEDVSTFGVVGSYLFSGQSYALSPGGLNPGSAAFSPDGLLYITANQGDLTIFQVSGASLTDPQAYSLSSSPTGFSYAPDGTFLAATSFSANAITLLTFIGGALFEGPQQVRPLGSTNANALAISPDSLLVATAGNGANVVTIAPVIGGILGNMTGYNILGGSAGKLKFSPDGSLLVVPATSSDTVDIFMVTGNTLSNKVSYPLPAGYLSPHGAAFNSDGSYLAISTISGTHGVVIYEVTPSGALLNGTGYPLSGGLPNPQAVAFSPDDSLVVTVNFNTDDVTFFPASGCRSQNPITTTTTGTMTTTGTTTTSATAKLDSVLFSVIKYYKVHCK